MRARRLLILFLFFASGCAGLRPAAPTSLCILHTSDIHGHIVPERVAGWKGRSGGGAVLAGCVKAIREENARNGVPTLLLDAGDFYLGTPEGDSSKGIALIELMNAVGYDAVAVGNHDWDGGVANLMGLAAKADFPFLGANVVNPKTGGTPPFLRRWIVKKCGPLRVGVAGITLEDSTPQEMPGGAGTIVCAEPEKPLREAVGELRREGVGIIVVASHLGMAGDKRIARDVEGVDVIVGGHDHLVVRQPYRSWAHGTLICHAGSYGRYLGRLDLTLDPGSGRVARHSYELIPLFDGRCPPDAATGAIVEKWRAATGRRFDEVVGRSESDFYKTRAGVAMMGEMIADAMREASGTQIAFNQRHGIRGPMLKGELKYRDVYSILPFDDTVWTVTLTGRQVRGILEKTLGFRRPDNLRFSGLTVEYDPAAPRGARITSARCGGKELDPETPYRVAVNTYLVHWGFIKELVAEGRDIRDTKIKLRDALADYIRSHSPLSEEAFRAERLTAKAKASAGERAPAVTPAAEKTAVPAAAATDAPAR